MMVRQRLMKRQIIGVRVALSSVKIPDDGTPQRVRHPERIDIGTKINKLFGIQSCQRCRFTNIAAMLAGKHIASVYAKGHFTPKPAPDGDR